MQYTISLVIGMVVPHLGGIDIAVVLNPIIIVAIKINAVTFTPEAIIHTEHCNSQSTPHFVSFACCLC